MSVITPYKQNARRIRSSIPKIAKQAIEENAEDIINILKFSQLGMGFNSDGSPLSWSKGDGFYAESTQRFADADPNYSRQEPKKTGQHYNFVWSGNTFAFMGLKIKGSSKYEIFTKGGKQRLLEGIYGKIFDLTEEHNEWVNQNIISPALYKFILENIFVV